MNTLFRVMALAQQSLIEAWYSRAYLLLSIIILICAVIGIFAGELVLSGAESTSLTIYNFITRIALASIIAIHTIQSLIRDRSDNITEFLLAIDMPREIYILGRLFGLLGILIIATILAAIYPLWCLSLEVTMIWAVSLLMELSIVVCLSIFVAISISNTSTSFCIVMGVYLLARNIGNLLLLSKSPVLQGQSTNIELIRIILEGINLLLPDLWRYAQSEWLTGGDIVPGILMSNVLGSMIFCLLLISAAAFDLHRKSL